MNRVFRPHIEYDEKQERSRGISDNRLAEREFYDRLWEANTFLYDSLLKTLSQSLAFSDAFSILGERHVN